VARPASGGPPSRSAEGGSRDLLPSHSARRCRSVGRAFPCPPPPLLCEPRPRAILPCMASRLLPIPVYPRLSADPLPAPAVIQSSHCPVKHPPPAIRSCPRYVHELANMSDMSDMTKGRPFGQWTDNGHKRTYFGRPRNRSQTPSRRSCGVDMSGQLPTCPQFVYCLPPTSDAEPPHWGSAATSQRVTGTPPEWVAIRKTIESLVTEPNRPPRTCPVTPPPTVARAAGRVPVQVLSLRRRPGPPRCAKGSKRSAISLGERRRHGGTARSLRRPRPTTIAGGVT